MPNSDDIRRKDISFAYLRGNCGVRAAASDSAA